MNRNKVAIIVVAVAIVFAAIAITQNGNEETIDYPYGMSTYVDDDGVSHTIYTFDDYNKIKHSVEVPISNVSVTHKYLPIFMKIIGKEDEVGGLDSTYGVQFEDYFPNSFEIGSLFIPSGEDMLAHGSTILLSATTMGVTNNESLNAMGIDVIYLDFANPAHIEASLEILVHLFADETDVKENADKYMELYNECYDFVKQFDFSSTANDYFCLYMSSSGGYHTHASGAVQTIESVSGQCFTHIVDPDDTKGAKEMDKTTVLAFDGEYGLDYLFMYGLDTAEEDLRIFLNSGGDLDYTEMTCFKKNQVYALSTDCINGALSPVSVILYAKAFGADVGDKAEEMVQKFNDAFGLNNSTENLITQIVL